MTAEQLDLIDSLTAQPALTVADIDEWTTSLRSSPVGTGHWPNDWAREGIANLLGKELPHGRLSTRELLDVLTCARSVAVEREG